MWIAEQTGGVVGASEKPEYILSTFSGLLKTLSFSQKNFCVEIKQSRI